MENLMRQDSLANWLIVVPARLSSTRLAHKPLQDVCGKPLIVRVYENLQALHKEGAEILVATDAAQILDACKKYSIPCELTDGSHNSGTDRCAEVSARHPDKPYILNVQGDEPTVSVTDLRHLMTQFEIQSPKVFMATLAFTSDHQESFKNRNVCKVVVNKDRHALYFSRSPIPFDRDAHDDDKFEFLHHVGIYAFHRESLAEFCQLPPSPLEEREKLEQLRALDNGKKIYVGSASTLPLGVDTPDDLERVRALY